MSDDLKACELLDELARRYATGELEWTQGDYLVGHRTGEDLELGELAETMDTPREGYHYTACCLVGGLMLVGGKDDTDYDAWSGPPATAARVLYDVLDFEFDDPERPVESIPEANDERIREEDQAIGLVRRAATWCRDRAGVGG